MKSQMIFLFLILVCGFTLSLAQSPPSQAQVEAITMPPPHYNKTKDLTYAGDYGYYSLGNEREFSTTENLGDPNLWYWVRYKNSGNVRNIWAWGSMNRYDVCSHGHISYVVWGKWQYNIGGIAYTGWSRLGLGTKSGFPQNNGSCKWSVNDIVGYGKDYTNSNISQVPSYFKFTEYVVGTLAVSHGGYCDAGHCGHPTYTVLYSLP